MYRYRSEIKRPTRFRILIIGRANAGKTTILRALCGDEEPEVYDGKGDRVDHSMVDHSTVDHSTVDHSAAGHSTVGHSRIGAVRATFRSIRNKITGRKNLNAIQPILSGRESSIQPILSPSSLRGLHKIDYSLIFPSNHGYVFHDSRGFESGAIDELELVRDFIQTRAASNDLDEQLHAIWYCFPTDGNRLITAAEQEFFGKIDTGRVPVIAVFTKFDALDSAAFNILEASNLSFEEAKQGAPAHAEELFKATHLPLIQNQPHPPKGVVYLRNMQNNHSHEGISDLIEKTFTSLDDDALKLLLVSVQHSNVKLCIKAAVESGIITDVAKALAEERQAHSFEVDARFVWDLLKWFPYISDVNTFSGHLVLVSHPAHYPGSCDHQRGVSTFSGYLIHVSHPVHLSGPCDQQDLHASEALKDALTPLPPSIAYPHNPSLEALLIGLAIVTVAANSFWMQSRGIANAFWHYVDSGASEDVMAEVLESFSKPISSYSTHACNTKLLQIVMDNHTNPPAVGQPNPA
ncbi:hypothetical protein BOTBODRAFT_31766 [Botryobasidium botryosum FD-172 SS1]|uniref:G domain-containing protein n=1 Tax=Botryobasidium botryosum (strain FD-172 SS1) TaxID=930990 RepID=A0A067MUA5_BOTB1|nr:hypothetical protein BOTBODRAFT_31766 [Botryobasidium botryosum FD-172 SS1]